MERYVRSRGISVDYHWLHIAEDGQESKEDPPISEFISLIKSDKLSLVLARRSDGQLILLVTGLDTKSRRDARTRPIRNSVAWVGSVRSNADGSDADDKATFDEATWRMLAAQSLKGSLTEIIDSVVTSSKDGSFQVDHNKLKDFETASKKTAGNSDAEPKRQIGKISEKLKNKLANELEERCLPLTHGPLVVVTEFKARKTLEGAKVWRGLSTLLVNNFDEFPEDWEEINSGNMSWNPGNSTRENILKNWDKKWWSLSLIIIVLGLPLAWWKLPFLQVAINPSPTSISFSTATPNPQSSSISSTPSPTVSPQKSPPSSKFKIICTASISEDNRGIDLKVETSNLKEKTMYVQMSNTVNEYPHQEGKIITDINWVYNFEKLNGNGTPLTNEKYYILGSLESRDTTFFQAKINELKTTCSEKNTPGDYCFVCITPK